MNICVCVGSSCHLKGAYEVVRKFQEIDKQSVISTELGASFCSGLCTEGVIVTIDGQIYTRVSPERVEELLMVHKLGGAALERGD